MRLLLASASERRQQLLSQIGITDFDIRPTAIDETPHIGELPRNYCVRIAIEKASAADGSGADIVLAADTVVGVGRRILGKPSGPGEAEAFLRLLSGRRHHVFTAVAVRSCQGVRHRLVEAVVKVKRLSDSELFDYLRSNEWEGKAGGYAIQGRAAAFIPWIRGSYTAIVGLPLVETLTLLRSAGLAIDAQS